MRKLATIRKIGEVTPILNSDQIICAAIERCKAVVREDEFQIGYMIVHCEFNSWIQGEIAPFLSQGKEPREYKGLTRECLKTEKLHGQINLGFNLTISSCS